MFAFDETEMVMLFPAKRACGVARFALFVIATERVVPVLFRNIQNTPPSVDAVVEAGSVILEKVFTEML